jgi:putative FmdB family regulatory protein
MPLYEYECLACGHRFERIQKFSDPPVDVCPNCGEGNVQKLVSSPAIQFKGTGWYITDYARKGGGADAKGSTSTDTSKESKESKETKGQDSKKASSDSTGSGSSPSTPSTPSTPKASGE